MSDRDLSNKEYHRITALQTSYYPLSLPATNYYRVVNIYINSENGKLVIQYDDTPWTEE